MKVVLFNYFSCWLVAWISCPAVLAQQAQMSTYGEILALADPHIFFDDGVYYLYGTGGGANTGFLVYTSTDMKIWEGPRGNRGGFALKKGDVFGHAKFWAPQVFRSGNNFYMAYAADEHIAIARSNNPLGPFYQSVKTALSAAVKQIDPFIFTDTDDKKYLYHVRVANGANRIFVAEMTDDLSGIKPQTLTQCISATEIWENTGNDKWTVAEGPTVLKRKNIYYLIYSANHFRSKDYAVGYAVSTSPYGPWKKYEWNPILSRRHIGENGTGHGDIFVDHEGVMRYVFHTHQADSAVGPRKTALVKMRFSEDHTGGIETLHVDKESFYFLRHVN